MKISDFLKDILINDMPINEIKKVALDLYVQECSAKPAGFGDVTPYIEGFHADVVIKLYDTPGDSYRAVPMPRHVYSEITYLLSNLQKINAIKIIRSLYNVGLKEAKDTIDNWNFKL